HHALESSKFIKQTRRIRRSPPSLNLILPNHTPPPPPGPWAGLPPPFQAYPHPLFPEGAPQSTREPRERCPHFCPGRGQLGAGVWVGCFNGGFSGRGEDLPRRRRRNWGASAHVGCWGRNPGGMGGLLFSRCFTWVTSPLVSN